MCLGRAGPQLLLRRWLETTSDMPTEVALLVPLHEDHPLTSTSAPIGGILIEKLALLCGVSKGFLSQTQGQGQGEAGEMPGKQN